MSNQLLAYTVATLCGVVIPAVVDVITKSHARDGVKAFLAAALSALAGADSTVTFTAGERWQVYVLAIVAAFVTTMTTHATGYSRPLQRATAGFGLGPANPAPADPLSSTDTAEQTGAGVTGPPKPGE